MVRDRTRSRAVVRNRMEISSVTRPTPWSKPRSRWHRSC